MSDRIYRVCVECSTIHVDNCHTCFGWGLIKGKTVPIAAHEVRSNIECDPCPECGGDKENKHLYDLKKEADSFTPVKFVVESSWGK